jgi:hypothetical protein
MSKEELPGFAGDSPRYHYSAAAAAEILNLHFDPSQPKSILFGRILSTIMKAMDLAEQERTQARWTPSEN